MYFLLLYPLFNQNSLFLQIVSKTFIISANSGCRDRIGFLKRMIPDDKGTIENLLLILFFTFGESGICVLEIIHLCHLLNYDNNSKLSCLSHRPRIVGHSLFSAADNEQKDCQNKKQSPHSKQHPSTNPIHRYGYP